MLNIWLIRHGESEANAGLPTTHPASVALTARGMEQAACIPRAFDAPPALLVTSPYLRTQQTARPLIERFGALRQEEWPIQEFTFLAPARYVNTTYLDRRPVVEAFWSRSDPRHIDGEGAESFADLIGRVERTLARLRELGPDGLAAVFTHGVFMRVALWLLLAGPGPLNTERMRRCYGFIRSLAVPNAAILKLRFVSADEVYHSNFITAHLPAHLVGC